MPTTNPKHVSCAADVKVAERPEKSRIQQLLQEMAQPIKMPAAQRQQYNLEH